MKWIAYAYIAILVAAFGVGYARAGTTITLNPAGGFGALHQYHGVTTNAVPDDPVTMYLPQAGATGGMSLYFDSEYNYPANRFYSYWIGTYNGNGVASTLQHCVFDQTLPNTTPCAPTSELLTVTITESVRSVRGSGSGRGGYAIRHIWTLLGGTVTK